MTASQAPSKTALLALLACAIAALPLAGATAANEQVLDITIDDAVRLAQRRNPDMQAARAEVRRAEGMAMSSLRVFLPALQLNEVYVGSDNAFVGMALSGTVPQLGGTGVAGTASTAPSEQTSSSQSSTAYQDAYLSAFVVTQPLVNVDGWHRRTQALRTADAAARQVEWTAAALEQAVVEAYWALPLARARVTAVQAGLSAAERAVEQAAGLHREGLTPALDELRARSRVAGLRAALGDAEAGVTAAHARLRDLLGIASPVRIVTAPEIPVPSEEPPPPELALANTSRRADLRAAEQSLSAARAGSRASKASFVPRLNALGAYLRGGADPLDDRLESWFVGVSLSWTAFSGLDRLGQIRAAEAQEAISAAELRGARSRAEVEIRTAYANLQAARAQIPQAEAELGNATEAASLAQGRYREGLSAVTELLDANAAELDARIRFADARYRWIVQLARYRRAGGWTSP